RSSATGNADRGVASLQYRTRFSFRSGAGRGESVLLAVFGVGRSIGAAGFIGVGDVLVGILGRTRVGRIRVGVGIRAFGILRLAFRIAISQGGGVIVCVRAFGPLALVHGVELGVRDRRGVIGLLRLSSINVGGRGGGVGRRCSFGVLDLADGLP